MCTEHLRALQLILCYVLFFLPFCCFRSVSLLMTIQLVGRCCCFSAIRSNAWLMWTDRNLWIRLQLMKKKTIFQIVGTVSNLLDLTPSSRNPLWLVVEYADAKKSEKNRYKIRNVQFVYVLRKEKHQRLTTKKRRRRSQLMISSDHNNKNSTNFDGKFKSNCYY